MPLSPCIAAYVIQGTAWPPTPPTPPPTPAAAVQVLGRTNGGSMNTCTIPAPGDSWANSGAGALVLNDLMVAVIDMTNSINGAPPHSMSGGLPAGWTLVRDDYNNGVGSVHGPMYSGIAIHFVTAADVAAGNTLQFTFNSPNPAHNNIMSIDIAVARGSIGVGAVTFVEIDNDTTKKITAAGVSTPNSNELVFVTGMIGTGSGSAFTSDSGMTTAILGHSNTLDTFYQFSSGLTSPDQGLTDSFANEAYSAYQIAMYGSHA